MGGGRWGAVVGRHARRVVFAGLAVAAATPVLHAQPQRVVSLTVTSAPAFPTATATQYGTGATPGQLTAVSGTGITVGFNPQPVARSFALAVRATAATVTGPWAKPVSEVRACWSAACTYVPLTTVFQPLGAVVVPANRAGAGALAGRQVFFRVALRWEQDVPGVYSVPLELLLTVTRP